MELTCDKCGCTFARRSKAGPAPRFCYQKECQLVRQKEATARWVAKDPDHAARIRKAGTERFKANNPDRRREWDLARKFNITPERYAEILAEQDGVCAICKRPETAVMYGRVLPLAVDHDHACCPGDRSCGECICGLLCGNCNRILGLAYDNAERLDSASDYLRSRRGRLT